MATRLFKVGFATTDTPADLQYMSAHADTGHHDTYQKAGAALQVTSGKTLYVGRVTLLVVSGSAFAAQGFETSTASVLNGASPAGAVQLGEANNVSAYTAGSTANSGNTYDVAFTIAQNLYFNIIVTGTETIDSSALGLMF